MTHPEYNYGSVNEGEQPEALQEVDFTEGSTL